MQVITFLKLSLYLTKFEADESSEEDSDQEGRDTSDSDESDPDQSNSEGADDPDSASSERIRNQLIKKISMRRVNRLIRRLSYRCCSMIWDLVVH